MSHKALRCSACHVLNVGHECHGQPFHQAGVRVRSQFPEGGWYVIRPSCLVQPLYGSVAIPVTSSWPLRCVTSEGRIRSQTEMDQRWWMALLRDVRWPAFFSRLPRGLLSFPAKSNYTWIINVFVLDLRWDLLAWSRVGVCQVPTLCLLFWVVCASSQGLYLFSCLFLHWRVCSLFFLVC